MAAKTTSFGLKPNPVYDLRTGLGTIWQEFPTTQADLANLTGVTFDSLWTMQETSGSLLDQIGSDDLSAANVPEYGIDTAFAGRTAVGMTGGTNDAFDAANNTIFDLDAATSLMLLLLVRFNDGLTIRRNVAGKRQATPNNGYEVGLETTGGVRGIADDGGADVTLDLTENYNDGAWHAICFLINQSTNLLHLTTELNTISGDITSLGTLTSTQSFSIGQNRIGAVNQEVAYAAIVTGANAEGHDPVDVVSRFWKGQ